MIFNINASFLLFSIVLLHFDLHRIYEYVFYKVGKLVKLYARVITDYTLTINNYYILKRTKTQILFNSILMYSKIYFHRYKHLLI